MLKLKTFGKNFIIFQWNWKNIKFVNQIWLLLYMNIKFIGVSDSFEREFLKDQYERYPEILKQEMMMTANILNKKREDRKKSWRI